MCIAPEKTLYLLFFILTTDFIFWKKDWEAPVIPKVRYSEGSIFRMESGMIGETYNQFFTGKEYPRFTVKEIPFLTGKEFSNHPTLHPE